MILKYKVPKKYERIYGKPKIIYCKILKTYDIPGVYKIYLVKMLNHHNLTSIFNEEELEKLSFIDKIVIRRRKYE